MVIPAATTLLLPGLPPLAPATAATSSNAVQLMLPSNVTIHLADRKSVSGVRLAVVSPSKVAYDKGGLRSLPLEKVARIAFQGSVELKAKGNGVVRGVSLKGCGAAKEVLLATAALSIQPDGAALAVNPDLLPATVRKDLKQTSGIKTLVVESLRFDPGGKVRLLYKACSPEA